VAEVNDKSEVTVEGEFVGRLEGFRFKQDGSATPDEAKTLKQAAYEALKPEFHLRADRFYNAPDTELDFTEQGGLMWGNSAVGKLVKGPEALKPQVEAFVDEEAGYDVGEKVRRRLQHFIDRKVALLFEPLLNLGRDEALAGLARGFAFRLTEAMGVLPRDGVADEVKALDQDMRGALRKHGVRFGQYTIFQPLLLKPAPTRLRLVLWSLFEGLDEFPESPPPGLVTVPNIDGVPKGYYTLSGYHPAGARAIRIDMLERLADILRTQDSRVGFEATPDMLSITGMTLEQFSDLMAGLGYKGERGEREKVRSEPVAAPLAEGQVANPITEEEAALQTITEPEVFYTFTWAPKPRAPRGERPQRGRKPEGAPAAAGAEASERRDGKPRGERGPRNGKPQGGKHGKPGGKGKRDDQQGRSFDARPPKQDRIDPDNPFAAALMGLRDKI
jgi:ATP-dependent RNA helicase SUPV3L1/SUV3